MTYFIHLGFIAIFKKYEIFPLVSQIYAKPLNFRK